MKNTLSIFAAIVIGCTASVAHALDKDMEVDILVTRITSLLKAEKHAEALPLFEQLERMNAKLPESFDYYYIDTLDKVARSEDALKRAESYLGKYGKKGKYYGQVIEIIGRAQQAAERAKLEAERAKMDAEEAKRKAERAKMDAEEAKRKAERVAAAAVEAAKPAILEIEAGMVRIPYIKPFMLGKTEVTQKQWRGVMGEDPPEMNRNKGCDNCPVTHVSWYDAKAFIQKLNALTRGGYRLPSVAESEFACRAGEIHVYCGSNNVGEVAWYDLNSDKKAHPVAQKKANAWGLYDMTGNVWEWNEDCRYGDCGKRRLFGGSWLHSADYARADHAYGSYDAGDRNINCGFRLARILP